MITLSPEAAEKVAHLITQENQPDLFLRIAVQPGGCSGLRYQFYFDNKSLDGDELGNWDTVKGPVSVAVDRMSSPYLEGAVVDYVDKIDKQGFVIDNPNAQGGCACGESFS
jgi:iron-sulfur cluster assembly accessory protein